MSYSSGFSESAPFFMWVQPPQ